MLSGDPKLGKSLITADLAARISAGLPWPVGEGDAPRGAVLFASAEDDPADTIRPRIEAAGGDPNNVHLLGNVTEIDSDLLQPIERPFDLGRDLHRLETELERIGNVVALIIDPVTAYLGRTDSHKNSEVRALLSPLSALASRHRIAVLAVSHLNKGAGTNALYRVSGSLAFTAAARSTWLVAKDQADPDRRLVLPTGSNIGPDLGGMAYRIEAQSTPLGELPTLAWETSPVEFDPAEALDSGDPDKRSERDEAAAWLADLLSDGALPAKDIQEAAQAAGLAWRTVQRAKDRAGVEAKREGFGKGSTYTWSMRAKPGVPPKGGIHG